MFDEACSQPFFGALASRRSPFVAFATRMGERYPFFPTAPCRTVLLGVLFQLLVACGVKPVAVRAPIAAPVAPMPASAPVTRAPATVAAPSEEDAQVPVSLSNPSWGSRTALVTIVEFADFECPFCARVEATLSRIREMYGPDTVRIVWKNDPLPFHRNARAAAEAGAGVFAIAGAEAFWRFHDGVLHDPGPPGLPLFERLAQDAGVPDIAAFRTGLAQHTWAGTVDRDMSEGEELGVFATPTFFINGVPLAGALPFLTFQGAIERQIRAARAKLAAGTAPERVYMELTQDNRASSKTRDDDHDDADTAEVK
jgi:protein-disulfide isomerase